MPRIDDILKEVQFSSDFNFIMDDAEYQKFEMLGDSIIKTYVVQHLFGKYERAGNINKVCSVIVSNQVLSEIYDELNLNNYFLHEVEHFKDRADVIEMIVGKGMRMFGFDYAMSVSGYFLDIVIHDFTNKLSGSDPSDTFEVRFVRICSVKYPGTVIKYEYISMQNSVRCNIKVGKKVIATGNAFDRQTAKSNAMRSFCGKSESFERLMRSVDKKECVT